MLFKPAFISILVLIILATLTLGCHQKKKKINRLQKFESELWIQDKNGCAGNRIEMKNQLLSLKHNMRGLKTDEIEYYLGTPDAQELYTRSQRYYIYFLEPGPKCENAKEHPQALYVRFSAVGIANEFIIKPL